MTREQAAEILERIALLLELRGENPFKIRAYKTGAETLLSYPGDIMAKAAANDLGGIKGLGDALRDKLHELATTDSLKFYEDLQAQFPKGLFQLFDVPGLGPKKIAALYGKLGVASTEDLKRVCESGEAEKLSGFGGKTVSKLLEAVAFMEAHASEFRLDQVYALAQSILADLHNHPHVSRAEVCGSLRRGKELVHDLDFLIASPQPEVVLRDFVSWPYFTKIIAHGATKASVYAENGLQCDVRAVSLKEFPFALNYFTGSKEHNVTMRQRALDRGFSLNEYTLTSQSGKMSHEQEQSLSEIHEEADLYRFLGMDYIPPELRENSGEFEAAEKGRLPRLVEVANLRGVFHNHTTASDGRATLREMAEAAMELGLQYLGIADHSKSSFQANGLNEKRLLQQIQDIRDLNAEYAGQIFLFTGSEVDVLKDGSLDFDDSILSELDYVVASVHNAFTLPEAEMTARILRAIENPYVTMIGHVTGRLLAQRPSYAVSIPTLIEAAASNHTIIELNASPWRLDMDWRWWRLAKEKGVRTSINPDAHSKQGLQDVIFGTLSARKGWLTAQDVINCLPLAQVKEALTLKRRFLA